MVIRTRIDKLPPAERAELEQLIAEARGQKFGTDRYVSDAGDASVPYLFLLALALAGIGSLVFVTGVDELVDYWRYFTLAFPRSLIFPLHVVAAQLAIPVGIWAAWKLAKVLRRHGAAVASFGFVRVRGDKVALVHWRDVIRLSRERGRRYVLLTLTTRDGGALKSFAGRLFAAAQAKLPPGANVIE